MASYDLVVAGAGIVGLAHALAAARRGLRVLVLERDAQANCASVRNFGFITITGQSGGPTRERALRSREVWEEVATGAGIAIVQRGAIVAALREEAMAVLAQFAASSLGEGCALLDAAQARSRIPRATRSVVGALWSPHELRMEAREALPALARWLAERHGVTFAWSTTLLGFEGRHVRHSAGSVEAGAVVVAPGVAIAEVDPALARRVRARQCKLQMLRIASPGFSLPAVVMSDLSLVRYHGFAEQPAAAALRARVERECAPQLAHGVHLIVAQGADGSLVVGDSHHYAEHADPFAAEEVDALILAELGALFEMPQPRVLERWNGYYPVAEASPVVSEEIAPRVRLVTVTSGTGMSTAFAIGEETVDQLFGTRPSM